MTLKKNNQQRDQKKKWLMDQIYSVIQNTGFTLSKFEYHPDFFGNVIVELYKDGYTARLTHDRGDIYMDSRSNNSEPWSDQQLLYNHLKTIADSYNTLIEAIRQLVQ